MIWRRRHDWTLHDYVALSWLVPGTLAVCASLLVFFLLGWLDYENANSRLADDLAGKSLIAARRLSAEILLGENGAVGPVSELLTRELSIESVIIRDTSSPCTIAAGTDHCNQLSGHDMVIVRQIPNLDRAAYVVVSSSARSYFSFLNTFLLIWSTVLVFLLLAVGLALQRYLLRHYIADPIRDLVSCAENPKAAPAHWPSELKDIAKRLADSFQAREQAVLAMLTQGVIHDLKTHLHSLMTATELVKEQEAHAIKRADRLERLFRACSTNVPKMRKIIELTLDGSRNIPIRPVEGDILATLRGAAESNQSLATLRGVTVKLDASRGPILFPHDPVQLERAFTNLIRNGIEAFEKDSPSNVGRLLQVSVTCDESKCIEIRFEDSGPGLKDSGQAAFTPLRSTKAHGAGLGLYVTRKIVQGHGGTIMAGRSPLLNGACFSVTLPALSASGGEEVPI